jgi:hypothetical protein
MAALIVLIVVGLVIFGHHGYHYGRNRRRGLSVWVSMRGPWGTRLSKRL